jgi:hypothetical protein
MKNKNTFIKLMAPKTVTAYLKEAKRVGYLIEKDDMSFVVKDDETNDLVFKGIRMNRTFYAVTFNKGYWMEPDRGTGYSASMMEEVR